MVDTQIARSISFKVSREGADIEFNAVGVTDQDVSALVNTFNTVIMGDKVVEAPSPSPSVSLEDALRSFLPADVREELPDHPENVNYQDTGIKYRRDKHDKNIWIKCYRTRYTCTNQTCKQRGTHYIPEGINQVKCHNCKVELDVIEATKEGFPNKDDYNNFFVAGDGA